jgi:hypothetical protein
MISISVIAAVEGGPGVGAHVISDHPLNHLLHPETAAGPYGLGVDVTFDGLSGLPGPLVGLGDGVSGLIPAFLHLGFDEHPLPPGITFQGTEINWPNLGIGQAVPVADSTTVVLHNLLNKLN